MAGSIPAAKAVARSAPEDAAVRSSGDRDPAVAAAAPKALDGADSLAVPGPGAAAPVAALLRQALAKPAGVTTEAARSANTSRVSPAAVPSAPEPQARAPQVEPRVTRNDAGTQADDTARRGVRSNRGGKAQRRRQADTTGTRLFVLDTNVLMHDPSAPFRFAEHDVFLPIATLEELDNHKKGSSEVSRNVRQVSRTLDQLIDTAVDGLDAGIALDALGEKTARGRLWFENRSLDFALPDSLSTDKADNRILRVVAALAAEKKHSDVVLVSKDINMRIKASMLGLAAEDYFNDLVVEDTDLLHPGMLTLPDDFWDTHGKGMESWQEEGRTFYRIAGPLLGAMAINQFVHFEGELPLDAQVIERTDRHAVLRTVRDYRHHKNSVWGIVARNREQNDAFNLLLDPDIDLVSLLGQAGTGKTLLALAAGLTQVLDQSRYSEIIVTRATVPVGDDIGYLPGTEEEKMQPWMGALEDNLEVLHKPDPAAGEWGRSATQDIIRNRIRVKSLSFMRGRTFVNKFLIIDEAQNLTPKQMKTLITRAGPGTKVVCLGNIAQIDTPYLTEGSSGLTYVVDRMRGWAHGGHITLQRGERSRLADYATEAL